ncbi:MAG: phage regulatory CII family protein [Gammaproteobacteria bacterium]|nr:phage regulatory CII family protein [Gammaproteobacteria bacterium]
MISFDAVNRAAYRTVHDHGGVKLAELLGMKPHVLLNKVNPDQPYNKLSLEEAVKLQQVTGDPRILYEMARLLGYIVIRIENSPTPCDTELLTLYSRWNAKTGDVHREIADAFDDARITAAEKEAIERQFYEATQAGFVYLQRMEGLVQ